jgi:hypothetical protein
MSKNRQKLIRAAFTKIDKDNSGVLTWEDLKGFVHPPLVFAHPFCFQIVDYSPTNNKLLVPHQRLQCRRAPRLPKRQNDGKADSSGFPQAV